MGSEGSARVFAVIHEPIFQESAYFMRVSLHCKMQQQQGGAAEVEYCVGEVLSKGVQGFGVMIGFERVRLSEELSATLKT